MTSTLTGPAVIARYLGPADHRSSRIVATHKRDSERTIRATVAWDHSLSAEANHRAAALALTACRELIAALTGGGSAESLALPLALARMATGAADVRPIVAGWALGPAYPGPVLLDCLDRPIGGLSFSGALSPAGALAAAKAAGWPLTAPMAHTAARLQDDPDPAAVAQALSAKGGCPAVVATLRGAA